MHVLLARLSMDSGANADTGLATSQAQDITPEASLATSESETGHEVVPATITPGLAPSQAQVTATIIPPLPPPPPPGLAPSQAETTDGRQGDHEIYRSTEFVQLIDDEEQLMQHKDMVLTVYYALSGRECLTMTWKKNGDGICDLAGVRVRG